LEESREELRFSVFVRIVGCIDECLCSEECGGYWHKPSAHTPDEYSRDWDESSADTADGDGGDWYQPGTDSADELSCFRRPDCGARKRAKETHLPFRS